MNLDEKIKVFEEGVQYGLKAAISRAEMVTETFRSNGDFAERWGACDVVYELEKLKESLDG